MLSRCPKTQALAWSVGMARPVDSSAVPVRSNAQGRQLRMRPTGWPLALIESKVKMR